MKLSTSGLDANWELRVGMQTLKRFLASCSEGCLENGGNLEENLDILLQYLEWQTSKTGDETCGDLLQAWSFAAQVFTPVSRG